MLDFFQGNRTPYKNAYAKGLIFGLNIEHTLKHIYRAILEGVAFGTKNIIDNQKRQGYDVDKIVACGGVTKDEKWMQIISDIIGREIIVNKFNQAGVIGCCVAAAFASKKNVSLQEIADNMVKGEKIYFPSREFIQRYEVSYQKYLMLYKNLVAMMSE